MDSLTTESSAEDHVRHLTVAEAAEVLHLSVPTIKRYIYHGRLQSTKLPGGQHRIAETEIRRLLEAQPKDAAGEGPERGEEGAVSPAERIAVLERWVTELDSDVERLTAALEVVSRYCAQKCDSATDAAAPALSRPHHVAVLGAGCKRCRVLYELVTRAVEASGRTDVLVEHITDLDAIIAYGPVVTPALVVGGEVVLSGRLPNEGALRDLLARHLG